MDIDSKFCEFKPTPNMNLAYGEGKRDKHKVSILKKSRSSLEGLLRQSKRSSKDELGI